MVNGLCWRFPVGRPLAWSRGETISCETAMTATFDWLNGPCFWPDTITLIERRGDPAVLAAPAPGAANAYTPAPNAITATSTAPITDFRFMANPLRDP